MRGFKASADALYSMLKLTRRLKRRFEPRPLRTRPRQVRLTASTELTDLWHALRLEYFPDCENLIHYTIGWSRRRQRRTLATCEVRRKYVRVAKEMRAPLFGPYLAPLVFHEMCHAVLGEDPGYHRGKRAWHGPRFKALERLHPGIPDLDAWIQNGGWSYAVRRSRALEQHAKRTGSNEWPQIKKTG